MYQSHTSVPEAFRKTLATVHGTFARELTTQLSAYLRATVTVKYVGLEEYTFAQFLSGRKPCSSAASIKASPLNSNLILDLEPSVLFTLVELLLGGKAAARVARDRPPTEIEKQVLALAMKSITAHLERTLGTVAEISLQFGGIEADAQLGRLLAPSDAVIVARLEVSVGDQTGSLIVLTPTKAAEILLGGAAPGPAEGVEISEAIRVSQTLMDASVRFDVWLDGVSLELRDLVQLREGYVIKFDYPTERNLQSSLNGVNGFPGQVVSTGRKRAFLIQGDTLS